MQTEHLIRTDEFCLHHHIDISFIHSLQESGLIEITVIDQTEFIQLDQLHAAEKLARLYSELDINLEGIEAISHLLARVTALHDEINALRNRLRLYES